MSRKYRREQEDDYDDELTLLDLFRILWQRKFLIIVIVGLFGGVAVVRSLLAPFTYRAEAKILPPSLGGGGRIEGLAANLGGLADLVGLPRNASSGQMLQEIIRSNSVLDEIIDEFNLMEEYSTDKRSDARENVSGGLIMSENRQSGIVTIAYIASEPQLAADIANAFIAALQHKLLDISANAAQQRRNFFESQLLQAQRELNDAEDAMINYQQKNGVVVFESQTKALLDSITSLRNQIAAKNVEISSMKSYARSDNPQLKLAQSQLAAMNQELHRLEAEQQRSDTSRRGVLSSDALSMGRVPELGIEYQHYVRALQFATAKYETMLRQYEGAKLSEANDISSISVLDYATPPDTRYGPLRRRMVITSSAIGLGLALGLTFVLFMLQRMKEEEKRKQRYAIDDDEDDDDDE